MKLFAVAVVLVFSSVAFAQEELKCETPGMWYAHTMEVDPIQHRARYGRIHYDEVDERVAFTEEVNNTNLKDIYLHKPQPEWGPGHYRINETSKFCQKYTLTRPFRPFGPDSSDRYDGEYYIGSSDQAKDGVKVYIYSGDTQEGGHFTGVWIPVPGDKCLPVSETYSEHRPGADQEVHIRRFYDIRVGEFDPNDVYQPPDYCPK